jgi:internalin A
MSKSYQIIELEKALNFQLERANNLYEIIETKGRNKYVLNSTGEIIGINLSNNQIVDLSLLSGLSQITNLNLSFNQIKDLNPLSGLIKLENLRLSSNQIKDLNPLSDLIELTTLSLWDNQIEDLNPLSGLRQLTYLDLWGNQIKDLNPLSSLIQLIKLDLANNQIEDLKPLSGLIQLIELDLANNQIEDLKPLSGLIQLAELNLSNNQIKDISPLSGIIQMTKLEISNNQIEDLKPLSGLIQLIELDLANNQIEDLKPLSGLIQLAELNLSNNQIKDISPLSGIIQMTKLEISNNQIEDLKPLSGLIQLTELDLSDNQIKDISPLSGLLQLDKIDCERNSLNDTLVKILVIEDPIERQKALSNYYENEKKGTKPFHEAKLMILGDPDAGKTNLRNYLMSRPFDNSSSSTSGVDIERWKIVYNKTEYRVNIWDFGGQWQQQQVHKFFITNECIYIILLDARRDTTPELWLDWIKTYAPNGKAIIVMNCMDDKKTADLKENSLKDSYGFIESFHYISLKQESVDITYKELAKKLRLDIENQILNLPNINAPYPQTYYDLKIELEDNLFTKFPYITDQLFQEQMTKAGAVGDKGILLDRLEEIGTLRHFSGTFQYILNPEWLSEGVYKIITAEETKNSKGVLSCQQFGEILKRRQEENKFIYEDKDFEYIRKMMVEFSLAYIDENQTCFIPIHFNADIPVEIKDNQWFNENYIHYYFQYEDYFPDKLICQFISKVFKKVYERNYWQEGIVLKSIDEDFNLNTVAFIRSDEKKKRIEIKVLGDEKHVFFKEIKRVLLDTQKEINFKYKEFIIDNENNIQIDYKKLVGFFNNKVEKFQEINDKGEVVDINVKRTLGIVEKERDTASQIVYNDNRKNYFYGDYTGRDKIGRDKNSKFNIYQYSSDYNDLLDELEKIKQQLNKNEQKEIESIEEDLNQVPMENNPEVAKGLFSRALERAKSFGNTLKDQAEKEVAKVVLWKSYNKVVEKLWSLNEKIDWLTIIHNAEKMVKL